MQKVMLASALAIFTTTGFVAYADNSLSGSEATCTTQGLPPATLKVVNGANVWVRPLAVIKDPGMDDSGSTAGGDDLVIFCVTPKANAKLGRAAFCLSKELCPWS